MKETITTWSNRFLGVLAAGLCYDNYKIVFSNVKKKISNLFFTFNLFINERKRERERERER